MVNSDFSVFQLCSFALDVHVSVASVSVCEYIQVLSVLEGVKGCIRPDVLKQLVLSLKTDGPLRLFLKIEETTQSCHIFVMIFLLCVVDKDAAEVCLKLNILIFDSVIC